MIIYRIILSKLFFNIVYASIRLILLLSLLWTSSVSCFSVTGRRYDGRLSPYIPVEVGTAVKYTAPSYEEEKAFTAAAHLSAEEMSYSLAYNSLSSEMYTRLTTGSPAFAPISAATERSSFENGKLSAVFSEFLEDFLPVFWQRSLPNIHPSYYLRFP